MNRKERAEYILEVLDKYVPHPAIFLDHKDPFTLLVAVLLSAQCTDERVNKVTPKLFQMASTPKDMAGLELEKIEDSIRSCGLYRNKAKAIKELSAIIESQYQGCVPEELEFLEMLPGVGHKTASVVVSQAFGKPAFPVDTHIHRSAKRWGLSSGKNVIETEQDLKKLFPEKLWNRLHLQMITFARKYCPAKGHDPSICPICSKISLA